MQRNKEVYKLVFTVSEQEPLGFLFEAWVVSLMHENQFSLSFRKVNILTIKDYDLKLSKTESDIIDIISEYSDESLTRKFSKKDLKSSDFLRNLDTAILSQQIRPYIEKRMARCFELFQSGDIPIHYKGKRKDAIKDEPTLIIGKGAGAVFHFERNETGIRYYITVRSGSSQLSLYNKGARILVVKPCILLLSNCIYQFGGNIDGNKLSPFFNKEFIQIPKSSEKKYFESFVQTAISQYEVEAKGFEIEQPEYSCIPVLKLEQDLHYNPVFRVSFIYGPKSFQWGEECDGYTAFEEKNSQVRFLKIKRNKDSESATVEFLKINGLENSSGSFFRVMTKIGNDVLKEQASELKSSGNKTAANPHSEEKHELIHWLNENKEILEKYNIEVEQKYFSEKYFTGEIRLLMSLVEEGDWFDIHGTVYFGEFKVSFIRLRNNILNNIREYILPDGTIAILPEVWFSRYHDLARLGNVTGESISLKRHHFALAKEIASHLDSSRSVDYDAILKNRKLDSIKIPDGLSAKLRPYQAEGYQWMLIMQQIGMGGCLADDMGLGKTLQTLVMLMQSKRQSPEKAAPSEPETSIRQLDLFSPNFKGETVHRRTSLIVMPLSLIHNWVNEIIKFSPGLSAYVHSGQDRVQDPRIFLNYDVILTTYGIVRNDLEMLRQIEFWYIILDESQLIKNPQSKLFRAVKQLKSKHRLVLTGTPIENSLVDLWAQLSFLNDGLLGSLAYFKEEYSIPIEKNRSSQQEEKLQKIIGPFILRRTKEMVARDLPSLTEQIYYCEMSEEQKSLYEEKKSEIRNMILDNITRMGTDKSRFVILKGLMQLRLLSNHPILYLGENSEEAKRNVIPSGKFEEVVRNLENLKAEGHKVLIYSQFVKHLKIFKEYFDTNGHDYSMLTGQTINEERQQVIREFQEDPNKFFFLITLKAGGVGLNLTAAEYVFLLDPWWNPAVENQAISRAHRIGQEKKVFSYKFITRDSIEEKIMQLQNRKSELASLFINNNNPLRFFTKETIVKLME